MYQTPPFIAWITICAPVVLASLIATHFLERNRLKKPSESGSYRWGYFFGCFNLSYVFITPITVVAYLQLNREPTGLFGVVLGCIARIICGWFILQKKKWAWNGGTIMAVAGFQGPFHFLSPIGIVANVAVWSINITYGKNRWTKGKWIEADEGPPHLP